MATDKARERAKQQAEQARLAPDKAGQPTVYDMIEQQKAQIARALPKTMTAERFARIVWTVVRGNKRLLECEPGSLMGAVMLAAQLGLEPGPLGHAYFVPFRDKGTPKVNFIIGYKGYIDLFRRSGLMSSIEAREVRSNDFFDYQFGLGEDRFLRHKPAEGDRGEPTHYYGIANFTDGGDYFDVLTVADVAEYRKLSKASKNGPWADHYSAMARKTVIRRMAPFLPLSAEAARAIEVDEGLVADLPDSDTDMPVEHDKSADVIDVTAETEPSSPQQRGAITRIAKDAGLVVDDDDQALRAEMQEMFGTDDAEELTSDQAAEFIAHLQGLAATAGAET